MKGSEKLIEEESLLVLGHLLQTPLKRLKDMWAATERGPDWMGRVEQARMWPLVTPLYSGIEQGLKVLAAKELGTPVRTATGKGGRLRACRHDLGCVWKEVGTAEKDLIEEHWRQFVSLHDYIPLTSAQAFVEHLSGPEGKGYEEWRYCLIASPRVRETSIEAMMQVWESIIAAIWAADGRRHSRGPLYDMEQKLGLAWDECRLAASVELQDRDREDGYDVQEHVREDRNWLGDAKGYTNAAAEILWRKERGIFEPEETPAGVGTRRTLAKYAEAVEWMVRKTPELNFRHWAARARSTGVVLKVVNGCWRCADRKPRTKARRWMSRPTGTVVTKEDDFTGARAREIRAVLYREGYEIEEPQVGVEWGMLKEGFVLWCRGVKKIGAEGGSEVEIWMTERAEAPVLAIKVDGPAEDESVRRLKMMVESMTDEEEGEWVG